MRLDPWPDELFQGYLFSLHLYCLFFINLLIDICFQNKTFYAFYCVFLLFLSLCYPFNLFFPSHNLFYP